MRFLFSIVFGLYGMCFFIQGIDNHNDQKIIAGLLCFILARLQEEKKP